MPDFRVDDQQHAKDESRQAGLTAMGLWTMAGSWSMSPAVLTDGWIPDWYVTSWPSGRKHATALVNAGLWVKSERDGQPGYQFTDWTGQRTAADIHADRAAARHRMRTLRSGRKPPPRSPEPPPDVRANTPRTFARTDTERSPEVPPTFGDSLTLTQGGHFGGVSKDTPRARENGPPKPAPTSQNRPPVRCDVHANTPGDPGPCGPCGDARRAAQRWDTEHARQAAIQRSSELRRAAELRAIAAMDCNQCDDDGRLPGGLVCDHDPHRHERNQRGIAAVRAALTRKDPA